MADTTELAMLLIKSGFSPADYSELFDKYNTGSTSSSADVAGGGSKSKTTKKTKETKKETKKSKEDTASDPATPSRVSPQYKMKLRAILETRYDVKTKAHQDKILDKFTKEWLKANYPENYHDLLKYNEDVAKKFLSEFGPAAESAESGADDGAETETEEVVKKTIDIEGKPSTVFYSESSGNVYNDKDELIGKIVDGVFESI